MKNLFFVVAFFSSIVTLADEHFVDLSDDASITARVVANQKAGKETIILYTGMNSDGSIWCPPCRAFDAQILKLKANPAVEIIRVRYPRDGRPGPTTEKYTAQLLPSVETATADAKGNVTNIATDQNTVLTKLQTAKLGVMAQANPMGAPKKAPKTDNAVVPAGSTEVVIAPKKKSAVKLDAKGALTMPGTAENFTPSVETKDGSKSLDLLFYTGGRMHVKSGSAYTPVNIDSDGQLVTEFDRLKITDPKVLGEFNLWLETIDVSGSDDRYAKYQRKNTKIETAPQPSVIPPMIHGKM